MTEISLMANPQQKNEAKSSRSIVTNPAVLYWEHGIRMWGHISEIYNTWEAEVSLA